MADINYVPQVDYTSRDYAAIRQDLINLIPEFAQEWTNRDTADFGITLIELFSYMGDLLNYYIDRAANEAFISTATQRDNVLQLAKLLGYTPTDRVASTVTLLFQNSSTTSSVVVPALTQVATTTVSNGTTTQVIFETDSEITVPVKVGAVNGSATVTATQGVTVVNQNVGQSNGSAGQQFELPDTSVISNSVSVVVGTTDYARVQYIIDYSGYDPVFSTYTNGAGTTLITFGDGVSGRIPPSTAIVYVTYRIGGGVVGNVPTNTIKNIIKMPDVPVIPITLSVSNPDEAATGGADPESTDSVRARAPQSIRAINRAVSLSDYSYLAVQVSRVAKAISIADVYSSVTIYVCPVGNRGVEIDNVTPTTNFNTLADEVLAFLVDKAPANTSITIQPPSYVGVNLTAAVTILPQYRQSQVQTAINAIINELLYIDNVAFADRITLQDVITTIASVPGVSYSQIQKLVRADVDTTYTISNKELTSNVATLTTSVSHSLTVGQTVEVSGVDSTFDGTFVVTGITSNTFSYTLVAVDVSSVAASGSAWALVVNDIVCDTNEIPELGTLSLTISGGITN